MGSMYHTRTRLPDGYMMLPIYVLAGRNIIPYPSPYRVKPVGYSVKTPNSMITSCNSFHKIIIKLNSMNLDAPLLYMFSID
jgi:hypothetical protein